MDLSAVASAKEEGAPLGKAATRSGTATDYGCCAMAMDAGGVPAPPPDTSTDRREAGLLHRKGLMGRRDSPIPKTVDFDGIVAATLFVARRSHTLPPEQQNTQLADFQYFDYSHANYASKAVRMLAP